MATYVDIGIGAILLIAIIVGLIKGFAKQFTKGLCGFIGLVGAICLTVIIMPALQNAGTLNGFASAASGWFSGEAFTIEINSQDEMVNALNSSGFLSILANENISGRIWSTMSAAEMHTLGEYFGSVCARLISGVVLWIVLLIIIKFIFLGIRKGLEKLSTLPVLRTLDRIFGVLWSAAICYIVLVVIAITAIEIVAVKWLPENIQETLRTLVDTSTVFKALHNTNIVGAYIARLVGVDLATLSPII